MDKVTMGPKTLMYPMPTVLLGANVGGKPNYMTAAWCGIACMAPPMISVAVNRVRHTLKGIEENRTFSINVPSTRDLVKTDYMGITSGARADKSIVFESFYGKLKTAPMAKECPVSLECKLFDTMKCGSHDLVVGEIVETYVDKAVVTGGTPDIRKVDPIIYSDGKYYRVGDFITDAFSAGKAYKKK
ncbi:flavoredoxin [Methanocella paludicola SANAE]|uniref:Flavoredoxin n=1 Tax=Methanocella paludicola (strain DSM 17711 / JCM 13418 / NBRC 101707 / SANAE) TaxID=304371 RepID=D1YVA8_METPS|nr:flavin reductase family protein [Methanocella paludicola]BAI60380.1 flavoredoxin [Methanocella paludicola SANAE]